MPLSSWAESTLLIVYYYSWERFSQANEVAHVTIGVLANAIGTALLFLANAWIAFMMSPAGVDEHGHYLGNVWHLLHSAWYLLNVHRFLADIMSGGAVVIAYSAYRFLTSKSQEERAYFDWVGYVFLFVTVCALLPMPLAGYWLMRSVYAFSQSMGVTMMGGLLTWLSRRKEAARGHPVPGTSTIIFGRAWDGCAVANAIKSISNISSMPCLAA